MFESFNVLRLLLVMFSDTKTCVLRGWPPACLAPPGGDRSGEWCGTRDWILIRILPNCNSKEYSTLRVRDDPMPSMLQAIFSAAPLTETASKGFVDRALCWDKGRCTFDATRERCMRARVHARTCTGLVLASVNG